MAGSKWLPLAAVAAFALTACEAKFGNDATGSATGNGSAENRSREGQVSISAPGFDMKIDIPEGLRREANMDDDSGVIYPNSNFAGIHVEGGRHEGRGKSEGEVELRFTSADAPDVVARWYQDPARAGDFAVASSSREGAAFLFAGTRREGGRFRVRIEPRAAGGTDGRALLSDTAE